MSDETREILKATAKSFAELEFQRLKEDLEWSLRFAEAKKRGLSFMECLAAARSETLTK